MGESGGAEVCQKRSVQWRGVNSRKVGHDAACGKKILAGAATFCDFKNFKLTREMDGMG